MNYLYWLSQITPLEQLLVGEQVFILSQLLQHGYPIVPGFVIGTPVLREFLSILDDSPSAIANLLDSSLHVNINDYRALKLVAQKSRQTILDATFPEQWQEKLFASAQKLNAAILILRPSLAIPHSLRQNSIGLWRSQVCFCQPEALSLALKKVWAELFGAKSLFYWQKLGIGTEKLDLAVLVQPLKDAIASGIIEIEPKTICIQATWGLGHSLLLGQVQPDVYEVERKTGKILKQQLGSKTLAYRLPSSLETAKQTPSFAQTTASVALLQIQDYLESYLVSEQEQNQYILDNAATCQLTQLTEELIAKRPLIKYLEWMSPVAAQTTTSAQFYFTQLNYYRSLCSCQIHSSVLASPQNSQSFLTGLAASPGIVTAAVRVTPQLELEQQAIASEAIVVTKSITPYQITRLQNIKGIITEAGGNTSHGAIIARELGIPAVVGVANATQLLQTGETVLLNGNTGEIYRLQKTVKERDRENKETKRRGNKEKITNFPFPNHPIATQLMVNLSQKSALANAASLPVDGVGLVRSELMLLDLLSSRSLQEWLKGEQKLELLETIVSLLRQFVAAFTPRPVFYRSFDWRAAEFSSSAKANPIVETRGTYHYLLDSTLFDLELEALARVWAEGYTNLNLILPFVRSVEEFNFCRRRVERVGLSERASFQLWIMAEVPSVIFLLPDYVKAGVQGIAIGINDLTQLLLGVDREQAHFAARGLHANHPAIVEAIAQLIHKAKTAGIPCSLCAHAPVEYPSLLNCLVRCGITAISVEPEAVPATYQAIARAEQGLLLEAARKNKISVGEL
ncbi:peptide chain release factor H [Pleurocapsales cyanobacterium LEGE 06147]|nr:peptide chain release factor H [Pleurocapsales cyanobacterium LEGE 06147]